MRHPHLEVQYGGLTSPIPIARGSATRTVCWGTSTGSIRSRRTSSRPWGQMRSRGFVALQGRVVTVVKDWMYCENTQEADSAGRQAIRPGPRLEGLPDPSHSPRRAEAADARRGDRRPEADGVRGLVVRMAVGDGRAVRRRPCQRPEHRRVCEPLRAHLRGGRGRGRRRRSDGRRSTRTS